MPLLWILNIRSFTNTVNWDTDYAFLLKAFGSQIECVDDLLFEKVFKEFATNFDVTEMGL